MCLIMPPIHHMQVHQMAHQLQEMKLDTNPTTTGNGIMATQAENLDQGMYM